MYTRRVVVWGCATRHRRRFVQLGATPGLGLALLALAYAGMLAVGDVAPARGAGVVSACLPESLDPHAPFQEPGRRTGSGYGASLSRRHGGPGYRSAGSCSGQMGFAVMWQSPQRRLQNTGFL